MKTSLEILKKANIIPKLRLAIKEEGKAPLPTGPHRVILIEDKAINGKDQNGNVIPMVRYIFEENGEKKRYDVSMKTVDGEIHYLVQRFAEVKEGQELILEMKKRGPKNYVSVSIVGDAHEVEVPGDDEEDRLQIDEDTGEVIPL